MVAYLPRPAMCRIDLHAGEAKTDARDTCIMADAARSLPHTLHSLKPGDHDVAGLTMLCGLDDDLAGQIELGPVVVRFGSRTRQLRRLDPKQLTPS